MAVARGLVGGVLLAFVLAACTSVTNPAAAPTATAPQWIVVTRSSFSLTLPLYWRVLDPKSSNLATDYGALVAENADFGKAFPLAILDPVRGAEVVAFDFRPGRVSETVLTTLIVSSETIVAEQESQYTRNYLLELRGATNYTNTNMRVGNAEGKRVTFEFPLKRSPDEILKNAPPGPDAAMGRETSFVAYPGGGRLIRLTFLMYAAGSSAQYESEFQTIADMLLTN